MTTSDSDVQPNPTEPSPGGDTALAGSDHRSSTDIYGALEARAEAAGAIDTAPDSDSRSGGGIGRPTAMAGAETQTEDAGLDAIPDEDALRGTRYEFGGRRPTVVQPARAAYRQPGRPPPGIGTVALGRVVRVTPYGAFIDFLGYRGLAHISQLLPGIRVERVEDVVQVGTDVAVRVIAVDPERRHINLAVVTTDIPAAMPVVSAAPASRAAGGSGSLSAGPNQAARAPVEPVMPGMALNGDAAVPTGQTAAAAPGSLPEPAPVATPAVTVPAAAIRQSASVGPPAPPSQVVSMARGTAHTPGTPGAAGATGPPAAPVVPRTSPGQASSSRPSAQAGRSSRVASGIPGTPGTFGSARPASAARAMVPTRPTAPLPPKAATPDLSRRHPSRGVRRETVEPAHPMARLLAASGDVPGRAGGASRGGRDDGRTPGSSPGLMDQSDFPDVPPMGKEMTGPVLPQLREVLVSGPEPEPESDEPATLEALAAKFGQRREKPATGASAGAARGDRSRLEREKQAAILARMRGQPVR